jgi:hypothetical protein
MVELREQANDAFTCRELRILCEELEDELNWIRGCLVTSGCHVRNWRRQARRTDWGWNLVREAEVTRGNEQAFRDELIAGIKAISNHVKGVGR